jgi:transcriptional regulator with XRE-family HTH domain
MNNEQERKRIGAEITARRMEIGMTQMELAEKTGIQQSHISRIEAGRYSVRFDTLQQIAEFPGCDTGLRQK